MENTALLSSKFPSLAVSANRSLILGRRLPPFPALRGAGSARRQRLFVSSIKCASNDGASLRISKNVLMKLERDNFASISSSNSSEMSTASGTPQLPVPPPPSYIGSPLFWIGVGVGISALFSMVATKVKQYVLQKDFKLMVKILAQQNGHFSNAAFPQGSPFPFPPTQPPVSSTPSPSFPSIPSPTRIASQSAVTVDVSATKVGATSPAEVKVEPAIRKEEKKYAFVDVSPEEVLQKDSGYSLDSVSTSTSSNADFEKEVSPNGAAVKQDAKTSTDQPQSGKAPSVLSVEAFEKMMEDPTVQKMVYPNNMGGSGEWDGRMMDSLKNFDLSSPKVKQRFDRVELTPEEVVYKIITNPEVAMAFQNPKVQVAFMDCSVNPLSIAKYQNDKEVMDVFKKISELFSGVTTAG